MADYQHVDDKAHESCLCWCGEIITFRLNSKVKATRCPKCGTVVLRSSVKKQKDGKGIE